MKIMCSKCNKAFDIKLKRKHSRICLDCYQNEYKKTYLKLKNDILSYYSNNKVCCNKCGKTDINILSIDHINGGGRKQYKTIGINMKGGISFYRWLKKNNYPNGYQVLCMGCQFIKRYEENECGKRSSTHKYKAKIKLNIITHYSNKTCKCNICGETDIRQLTIDHINNDGAEHRKITGGSGNSMYEWIVKNNYPNNPPLQVLCINCNMAKGKSI